MSAIRGNKSELAKQDKLIKKEVRGHMIANEITVPTIARRLNMSERTFARRMNSPGTLTLTELRKLAGEMGWSKETAGEVLFG